MPRLVRIGRMSTELISSTHAYGGAEDSGEGLVTIGNLRTDRFFRRRNPRVISRAALRRGTGDPKWYMSSVGPQAGALFVDTDGHRIQDGDDF